MQEKRTVLCAIFSKVLAISLFALTSLSSSATTCPELPADAGPWKNQEQWAWKMICSGQTADFRAYGGSDDPGQANLWPPQRELSARFLETVLFRDSYRASIPRQGVKIIGARFRERLDLSHLKLERDLLLRNSSFEKTPEALNLVAADIAGHLDLTASTGLGVINMDSLRVGNLSMCGGPNAEQQWLRSRWNGIWLRTARIDGQLNLNDTTVANDFEMTDLMVGTNLYLINATLAKVMLRFAKVGGTLDVEGPKEPRPRPKNFPAFQLVDLTGAMVGKLQLGSKYYGPINGLQNWGGQGELVLTGASVHTLQDGLCPDGTNCPYNAWPHLKLIGFTFQQLESSDGDSEIDMASRSAGWWVNWLGRQSGFSPEPYHYLADTLSKLGHEGTAKNVLYAGREAERRTATFPVNIELWLQRVFIGYGYRTYYSLFWVVAFVIAGAIVMRISKQGPENKMPYAIAFSFDMLLPIIKLREYHYKVDLKKGWVRYYFYCHKLMGYVLASFLIAGLSGLTK